MKGGQFVAIIKRLTYKPNHRIRADYDICENQFVVRISAPLPNVKQPHELTPISLVVRIGEPELASLQTTDDVLRWVSAKIVTPFEMHERNEWLRLDGKPIVDPHP